MKGEVGEKEREKADKKKEEMNQCLTVTACRGKEKGNGRNMRGGEKKRRLKLTQRRQNKETG